MRAAERGLDTVRPDSWKGEAQVCAVAHGESEELEGEEEEESTTEEEACEDGRPDQAVRE